jgi:AcrR family transcriptional regulator
MTPDSRTPKFRRRADARPDEVLDAALELFTEQGFAKTTVDQVARRAGLSKGAVYLYFSSKEALLEGLVTRAIKPISTSVFEGIASYKGDPRPVLARFLRLVAQVMAEEKTRAVPLIVFREAPANPAIAALFRTAVLDRSLPAMVSLLTQGVEGGYIRPVDPELTARTVIGPVLAHVLLSEIFGIAPDGGLQMDRLVDNHLAILMDGLAPTIGGTS